jgi:hypothetical protein
VFRHAGIEGEGERERYACRGKENSSRRSTAPEAGRAGGQQPRGSAGAPPDREGERETERERKGAALERERETEREEGR